MCALLNSPETRWKEFQSVGHFGEEYRSILRAEQMNARKRTYEVGSIDDVRFLSEFSSLAKVSARTHRNSVESYQVIQNFDGCQ